MERDEYTERKAGVTTEESSFLLAQGLPVDQDKVTDFKKRLEEFLVDEEEDLIGDMSGIVPDSRPYDKNSYSSILLNARSSRAICQRFETEPSGLVKSDAAEFDFSLHQILERMKEGHKVYKYNYNTPSRKIVTIRIREGIVEIFTSEAAKNRISFADVYGVTLGACSSTFRMYKGKIDEKIGTLHSSEDCFSIINELRSYDFATTSAVARYDICLSLSWLCTLNNSLQSNVPFTKCNPQSVVLGYKNIRDKLFREAAIRLISVHELFIVISTQLAIYKTMKQKENNSGMNKIISILNKRFTFSGKLYRFIKFIVLPLILSDGYTRKEFRDKIRVNLLISNKLKVLASVLNREEEVVDKLEAKTKRTVLESMIVPSCKSIFKEPDKVDPFLAMLRQKAAK
jgi:hypothetical protein